MPASDSLNILLVEDSRAEARYTENTLGQVPPGGHRIRHADCVAAALKALEAQDFDVVLLDLGLPDCLGFSGLHAILNVAPRLPVVVLTGLEDAEVESSAMEHGAQDYLLKNRASVAALTRSMQHAIQRKQTENLKSEFISIVSHELRTPLTSIHGSLGLISGQMMDNLPEPVARLVTIAQRNSERLIVLINDVLDIEKIESGQMSFDVRDHNLAPILAQVVEGARGFAEKNAIHVRCERIDDDIVLTLDGNRLLQVLGNFVNNAIKFSEPGGEVVLLTQVADDRVTISVSNRGIGIRKDFHEQVFGRFSQADATITRRIGGAGLGLYICKQMVLHMGGEIGFTSEPGEQTVFWARFRCAAARPAATPAAPHLVVPEAALPADATMSQAS